MSQEMQVAGVTVYLEGEGPETIVMLHGWPDTHRVWSRQVAFFQARYRCVTFTLPGFGDTRMAAGYSLDEVTDTIRQIVDAVSPDSKVILMLHDWGCVFGYQFAMLHPERVARMIAIDVGDSNSPAFERGLKLGAKAIRAHWRPPGISAVPWVT